MAMKKNLLLLLVLFLLGACTDDDKNREGSDPVNYAVNGKVEKGPFIKGSTVTLQPLDSKFNQTGNMFSATITDDEGNFDFGSLELTTPYALLTTNGFFYDEVKDRKSAAPITLQALVDLSDHSTVNVNILTHLKKDRLKKLVADGLSYSEANKQAQTELLTNFGLQKYADTDVSKFTITAGTHEAAALIVVSSVFLKGNSEAELTEELAEMEQGLAASGKLSEETIKAYREKAIDLSDRFEDIQSNIVRRYSELGKEVSVKDLSRYVDWDDDGIAGNEFRDAEGPIKMKFEKEELIVPASGGTFQVKIEANARYAFTNPLPSVPNDAVVDEQFNIFQTGTLSYTQEVKDDVLYLTIQPAASFLMEDKIIRLYGFDGNVHATLTIKQAGDSSKIETLLTENGKSLLSGLLGYTSLAKDASYAMEALYTKTHTSTDPKVQEFVHPPVKPDNPILNNSWNQYHAALRAVRVFKLKSAEMPELLSYAACWEAMLYYDMAVLWENVPFAGGLDIDDFTMIQMPSKQLFEKLEGELQEGMNTFEDKKTALGTVEEHFFVSKDVARLVLAKMYMYQKEYAKAAPLLEEIIQGGRYEMDSRRGDALAEQSRELIFGLKFDRTGTSENWFSQYIESGDEYLSVGTYTEVLLSAAECAYRMGDTTTAKARLDKVIRTRGLSVAPSADFMTSLKTVWQTELKATFSYFAFLKRNDLAVSELSLEDYQLILPIPIQAIHVSPGIEQNPGYR